MTIKWEEPFADHISSEMWKVMNWPIVYPVHGGPAADKEMHTCTNGVYRGEKLLKTVFWETL